jgi:hypothetical protein
MKRLAVLGILILALVSSLMVGCTDKEMTPEELEQMVMDIVVANSEVQTVKFDITTNTAMVMVGGPNPGEATMAGAGTGAIDSTNRAMQMMINMDIDVPGEAAKSMPLESYLVNGWMHIKVSTEETGAEWVKMQLPDDMWDSQSQLSQQIEMLQTAEEVNFLGSAEVNGTDCYLVEIVPGAEVLRQLLSEFQMPDIEGVDAAKLNLGELIKELAIKQWIAKDGYLIMQSETHVIMEISPEDVGADVEEFQQITADQSAVMLFYDFNEPVSIELPAEALD